MKEQGTIVCETEIAAAAKIIQLLLKMEADIIADKGSLIIPSCDTGKEGYAPAR